MTPGCRAAGPTTRGRRRALRTQLALEADGRRRGRGERAARRETLTPSRSVNDHTSLVLRRSPARGERRLDVGAALPPGDERVEDLTRDEAAPIPSSAAPGIERRRARRAPDSQLAADRPGAAVGACADECHESPRDHERHKDRHQESQNGSDTSRRRRGHRELYTWNPLLTPLVSTTEEAATHRVQNLLTNLLEGRGWARSRVTEWQRSRPAGEKHKKFNMSTDGKVPANLDFLFTAAYTSSTR